MERWVGRVALVTGASVGIGAAIAASFVKQGMKVVGCARNVDQIQELATQLKNEKGTLYPIKCDLTKEEEILTMFDEINSKHGGVDVLINNAGLGLDAPLIDGSTEQWRCMFELNVMALSICTREALKSMRERGVDDGHVIHMGSIMGHKVFPGASGHFYSVTKFAVRAHLEGLRHELRTLKSHIRVTEICPGYVETEFLLRMIGEEAGRKRYQENQTLQAGDIADSVIYVLSAPPHVQVHDIIILPTEQVLP